MTAPKARCLRLRRVVCGCAALSAPRARGQEGLGPGTLLPREPFSPAGFCGGEGADRRMRGRFTRTSFAHEQSSFKRWQIVVGRSHTCVYAPLIRLSAPSPPAKNRGGRRTLDEKAARLNEQRAGGANNTPKAQATRSHRPRGRAEDNAPKAQTTRRSRRQRAGGAG